MIRLENVSKYYYSSSNVCCALRKINLEFKMGEFVAVTGESGSGKTTLLNIISGFDSYEDGEIYINDEPTSYYDEEDWERYRKNEIAFIFQSYNLIDSYSVLENVMVTYILEGVSIEVAKEKSLGILKQVGLDNDVNKKTSKLSGGQKQRLAIARALAKETNIIVADEPTGNLDEENGNAVLQLLKNLSKDKLVIIVTHNQSQVEPYITRRIRLHDGEVVSDDVLCEENKVTSLLNNDNELKDLNKVINFSFLNLKAQPVRTLLIFLITLITVLASFIFMVNFKANINDAKTKTLDNEIFINFDDTRLLVRTFNQDIITNDLMEKAKVDKVVSVEKYDYVTDVNYFRSDSYKYIIENGYTNAMDPVTIDMSYYQLIDFSHFMRSSVSLDESMLAYGRLPENPFEMVVYAKDDALLNTVETVLFNNQKNWNTGKKHKYELKIVGILKEPTSQAYFSEKLCQVFDAMQYNFQICLNFKQKVNSGYSQRKVYFSEIAIDPNIGEYDISFSEALLNDAKKYIFSSSNNTSFGYQYHTSHYAFNYNQVSGHDISPNALGLSIETFDKLYSIFGERKQFALFIEDYAYINEVQKDLVELEFDSISCFESSTTGYDISKVIVRYVNLVISIVALIVMNIICVILIYTVLKFRKNDYLILKMNGMSNNLCTKINTFEIMTYGIISYIVITIIVLIVSMTTKNEILRDAFKYVRFYDYLILFGVTLITMGYIVKLYSKYLKNRVKISSISED